MFSLFNLPPSNELQQKALDAINASYKLTPKENQQKFHPVFLEAIDTNNILVVKLLSNYVDINQYFVVNSHEEKRRYETTYLIHALKIHNEEIVKLLLAKGAKVNAPEIEPIFSRYGDKMIKKDTPLIKAARNCPTHYSQLLIESKANVHATNEKGETALHIAADRQADYLVTLLIEAGANVMAKTKDGKIPYAYAVKHGFNQCVTILGENMQPSGQKLSCRIL